MIGLPTSFIPSAVLATWYCLLPLPASADIPAPPPSAGATDATAQSKLPLVAAGILLTAGVGPAEYVAMARKNTS